MGEWLNGFQHGQGKLQIEDECLEGEWERGRFVLERK